MELLTDYHTINSYSQQDAYCLYATPETDIRPEYAAIKSWRRLDLHGLTKEIHRLPLTPREVKVMLLVGQGKTYSEIGLQLKVKKARVCQILKAARNKVAFYYNLETK